MAVVGTAWIRVKVLSNKLGDDIAKSVEKSFNSASPAVDKAAENIGKKVSDGINDGMDKNAGNLVDRIDKTVAAPIEKQIKDAIDDAMDTASDKKVTINADADTGKARAKIAAAVRPRRVKIMVSLDAKSLLGAVARLSGIRFAANMANTLQNALWNLDKAAPKIALVASGVMTLAAAILAGTANVFVLAGGLAQIAAASVAIPGMFMGMAAGGAVLVMSLKDMKKVLKDLGPEFGKLQDSVSKKFWAQAEEPIRNLVETILPTLKSGLGSVSTGMGRFVGEMAKSLSAGKSLTLLKEIFGNTASALNRGVGGVKSWTSGFLTLGMVGSAYLPRMASWLNDIGDRFDKWIGAAVKSGAAFDWIDNALKQIRELGRMFTGLGGIFSGIFKAAEATGGSTLKMFADGLHAVSDAINGPIGQGLLQQTFLASHAAMKALGPGVSALGDAFAKIVPILDTMLPQAATAFGTALSLVAQIISSPEFTSGISGLVSGLQAGMEGLAPTIGPIGAMLGSIGTLAGILTANIGGVLGSLVAEFGPSIARISDAIGPIATSLGDMAQDIIAAFSPAVTWVLDLTAALLENKELTLTIAAGVLGVVAAYKTYTAAAAAVATVTKAINLLKAGQIAATGVQIGLNAAMAANPIGLIIVAIAAVVAGLTYFFTQTEIGKAAWSSFVAWLTAAWQAISATAIAVWNGIASFFTGLWAGITGAPQAVLDWFNGTFVPFFVNLPTMIWNGFLGLVTFFASLPGLVIGAVANLVVSVVTFFTNMFVTVVGAVGSGITSIVSFFVNLPGMVVGAVVGGFSAVVAFFSALPGMLISAVTSFGPMIVAFFGSALARVSAAVSAGASAVISFFGGIPGRVIAALGSLASQLFGAFSKGMSEGNRAAIAGVAKVISTVAAIPGKVVSALGNLGSKLYSAGSDLVNGLVNGIKSAAGRAISAAKGVVDGAINAAKNLLGIKSPSKVFAKIGMQTGQGLVLGMNSMESAVSAAGASLASSGVSSAVSQIQTGTTPGSAGSVDTTAQSVSGSSGTPASSMTVEDLVAAIRAALTGLGIDLTKADVMADYVAGKLVFALESV